MTFKSILKLFLIWQVAIIFVSARADNFLPLQKSDSYLGGGITHYLSNPLVYSRSNFDGVHYVLIATHGYNFGQHAFFPFYSNLIRMLRPIFVNAELTGAVISSICFLVGLYVLNRLIQIDYSPQVSRWTIIAILLFPTAFFFSFVYTEGLFFLLTVSAFYSARRSHWLAAAIFGFFASYTRLVGIFIFPALLIELWSHSQAYNLNWRQVAARGFVLLLIPAGLLLYMNYLRETTGDPLAFYSAQKLFNQDRSLTVILPYQVYWRYIKMILTVSPANSIYYTIWLEFLVGIIFSLLTLVSVFRQRFSYAIFGLFAFAIPTFTGNLVSLPRYVLICFPAFILVGSLLARYPRLRLPVLVPSFVVSLISLTMFVQGYWLA